MLTSSIFRSQGFWMREASYREQPDIHFQHELLLVAETRAGRQLGWATFGAVNTFLEDGVSNRLHKSKQ